MSGIAGLIRFDDRSVTRRDLERAANALNLSGQCFGAPLQSRSGIRAAAA